MLDSVIFDVDGTLWDSTSQVALSWQATCRKLGVPSEHITGKRLQKEFGKTMEDIGYSLFPDLPPEEAVRITKQACDDEIDYLRKDPPSVYPDVPELFKKLFERQTQILIVSNCQSGYIEALLDTSGLSAYVRGHLCPGDTGYAKAGNIALARRRWHLARTAYAGDTIGDFNATKEAGDIPFIFASYGFGSVPHPDAVISRPLELLPLVEQF